nr:ribonuclease H-like domain-containing protein [Tanacetum cinerariifolium]
MQEVDDDDDDGRLNFDLSTNKVNTTYGVSTANTQANLASTQVRTASTPLIHEDLKQIHEDDLKKMDLKWQLALLSMKAKSFFHKTGKKITINGSNIAGFDKSKVECYNCHKIGYFAKECRGLRNQDSRNRYQDSSRRTVHVEETPPKAMVVIDGVGLFLPPKLDFSNSGLEEFQQPKYKGLGPKTSKSVCEDISNEVKEYSDAPLVKDGVSDNKDCLVKSPVMAYTYYCQLKINAAKYKFTTTGDEKPSESEGFEQIINFLNANPIKYVLTVNPTIYTSCIKEFWATAKVKTVNREEQIHALVDKKKVIITETSVRSDLRLKDVEVYMNSQVEGMLKHKEIYVTLSHTKKIFANMKRQGKDFSCKVTHLFETMMVHPQEDMGEDSDIPTDSHHTPTVTQPSTSSQPQQKQKSKKPKKISLSGEDRLKLTELMDLCTQLQSRVLALETTKANQALEIRSLKRRMKKLEKKTSKKTHKLKRLYKIGSSTRVESFEDSGLGDQEDASKQGRMIDDLNANEGVTLVDETQGRSDQDMFDTSIFVNEEVVAEKEVSTVDPVPIVGEVVTSPGVEVVTTAHVEVSTAAITSQIYMDEITLTKALIDIKTSKPKTKGIVMQEPSETPTPTLIDSSQQSSKAKYKCKAKMTEPEKPLKRKDQIMIDEEVARNLEALMQDELEEEKRLARQKEEKDNIALIK